MKQSILFRHAFPFFFVASIFVFSSNKVESQILSDAIYGPYQDHPGPYYIRVFVNFVQNSTDTWTSNWNLPAEANAVMTTLNAAFNEHQIYFLPYNNPCDGSTFELYTTSLNVEEIRDQLQNPNILDLALHIYVCNR